MGFLDAIDQSGWHAARQADAGDLVEQMRESLRRTDFDADPDRVFNNMDSDALIPDVPSADRATSRLEMLDDPLMTALPATATGKEVKDAAVGFCRAHKQEGPDDPVAQGHVLGRVWPFAKLDGLLKLKAKVRSLRMGSGLRVLVKNRNLAEQRAMLATAPLGEQLMWSFYHPTDRDNPFRSLGGGSDSMADRLGLGEDWSAKHDLVKWGHRLPLGMTAHTPTAWDGGADNPYWFPGGRTRPLSADGGGSKDPAIGPDDGLPEVVHDPVMGSQLAIPIAFVAS